MYRDHFGLQENPFTVSPDPRFFYLAPGHAESVAKCEYAIRNKSGLAVVYGDVGTGKTTILNELRQRFDSDEYTIAVLTNPNQTSDTALLKAISEEFGLKPPRTKRGAFDCLQEYLAVEIAAGRTPLLLLDEAQDLRNSIRPDRDMLGLIKTLTNLMLESIDAQVVNILMNLKPPENWRKGITKAMAELLGEKDLEERQDEIRARIKRMDVRWDNGFISDEQQFLKDRLALQMELEQLTPVLDEDFNHAVETLENFSVHWQRLEGKEEERHELIKLIVERVYIEVGKVVAMTLKSNYHLVLGHKITGPTEVSIDPVYQYGSDGDRHPQSLSYHTISGNWFVIPIACPTPRKSVPARHKSF